MQQNLIEYLWIAPQRDTSIVIQSYNPLDAKDPAAIVTIQDTTGASSIQTAQDCWRNIGEKFWVGLFYTAISTII